MAKVKRSKSKQKEVTIIHYTDFVDFTEVAAILLQHFEKIFEQSPMMALHYATQEPIDPQAFGEELAIIFTNEDIQELLNVDQGPGILLGMYLAKKEFESAEQHQTEEAERLL